MEKRQAILNELNSIAPVLAQISAEMPYTFPAGYFDVLPLHIASQLGYSASELMHPAQTNPFTVPAGYFENLSGSILQKIKEEEFAFPIDARNMPYKVPADYFDRLSATVLQNLRSEEVKTELASVAPLLNEIPKINVYKTPAGYFGSQNATQITGTKVIKMGGNNWMKYAAAAAIIGAMAIGIFIFVGKNNRDSNFGTAAYHQAVNTNIDTALSSMNDKELNRFLADNAVIAAIPGEELDKEVPEVNELMRLISDEELQQSLKEQTVVESSGS